MVENAKRLWIAAHAVASEPESRTAACICGCGARPARCDAPLRCKNTISLAEVAAPVNYKHFVCICPRWAFSLFVRGPSLIGSRPWERSNLAALTLTLTLVQALTVIVLREATNTEPAESLQILVIFSSPS